LNEFLALVMSVTPAIWQNNLNDSTMPPLHLLPAFADDDQFHVVVESPRGSTVKMKYRSDLGAMSISRPLPIGLRYPVDWGFIPSTSAPDGDPVDAAVYWDVASFPGVVIACRALAVLEVEQNSAGGRGRVRNDRIIALPVDARRQVELGPALLTARVRMELENFFIAAAALEGKDPKIVGWGKPEAALQLLRSSLVSSDESRS
jgi:inorganic pyrophosphatase